MRFPGGFIDRLRAVVTEQRGQRRRVWHFLPRIDALAGAARAVVDQECEAHQTGRVFAAKKLWPAGAEAFPVVRMLMSTKRTPEDEIH